MTVPLLPHRYSEERRLSERVVLARDRLDDRPVACKLALDRGRDAEAQLVTEFEALRACAHPHLPQALDFAWASDGRACLVMERISGLPPKGPLGLTELGVLGADLCEALALLHSRGLLHRDVKPENVLFDEAAARVVLLDLGFAEPVVQAREIRGTVGYMAPEVLGGQGVDARADLYSLGALLHEAATGRPAFSGSDAEILLRQREGRFEPVQRLRAEIPAAFAALLSNLLDPNREKRPANALDVRERLLEALGRPLGTGRRGPLRPAFAGRERALQQLEEAAGIASERTVRIALSGPGGAGCTRVLQEMQHRLLPIGRLVLSLSLRSGREHPFARLTDLLRAELGELEPRDPGHSPLRAALAALRAAAQALPASGRGGPLVLTLDDLHRADAAVQRDVEALWHQVEGLPLLLVTAHDCERFPWPPAGGAGIDLAPLRADELEAIASSALCGAPPEPLLEKLGTAPARQPGPVLDTLLAALDSGLLDRVAGRWSLTGSLDELAIGAERAIPVALAGDDRSIAAALVVLDGPAGIPEIAALCELEPSSVLAASRNLRASGLAELDRETLTPTLRLVEAAGAMFGREELRSLHDRVLASWEPSEPASAGAPPSGRAAERTAFVLRHRAHGTDPQAAVESATELATALLAAGSITPAFRAAELGLERLTEIGAAPEGPLATLECRLRGVEAEVHRRACRLEEAASAADRAAEAGRRSGSRREHVEALRAAGAAWLRSGRPARAEGALAAALSRAGADEEGVISLRSRARLLLELAAVDRCRGAVLQAEERLAEAGFLLCGADDRAGEAQVLVARARLAMDRARFAEARELLQQAVQRFDELGEALSAAKALKDLGWAEYLAGSPRRAARTLRTGLNLAERLGDLDVLAGLHVALGAVCSGSGSPAEAVAHYRRALTSFRQSGDLPGQLAATNNLGWQLLVSGEVAAAVTAFREVLDLGQRAEQPIAGALTRNNLGLALCAGGDYTSALEHCRRSLELAEASGDARVEAEACWGLGQVYSAFGATDDALAWQRRALETSELAANPLGRAYALSEIGPLLARAGDLSAADQALEGALHAAEECGEKSMVALSRVRLGALRAQRGQLGAGVALLREGLSTALSCGDRLVQLEAERLLGELFCELGDFASGLPLLQEALEGCRQAGCLHALPAAHRALAAAHLRRALRLKTTAGAVVDRQEIDIARGHLERGLDLALSSGRMADRVDLRVLAAAVLLIEGNPRVVLAELEEAQHLADETGDRQAAARSRLLQAEALVAAREYGQALRVAREACEELARIGLPEESWRAHALLAGIHGAWGVAEREAEESKQAEAILDALEDSISDRRLSRFYRSDLSRRAARGLQARTTASRRRRSLPATMSSERFAGQVDAEDLVEELLGARARAEQLETALRRGRERLVQTVGRRRLLESAARLLAGGPLDRVRLRALLASVARALGAERAFVIESAGGTLCVRAGAEPDGSSVDLPEYSVSAGVVRAVLESGLPALSADAGRDERFGRLESVRALALRSLACVPLSWAGNAGGVLYVDNAITAGAFRRRDVRVLEAVGRLLGAALLVSGRGLADPRLAEPEGTLLPRLD